MVHYFPGKVTVKKSVQFGFVTHSQLSHIIYIYNVVINIYTYIHYIICVCKYTIIFTNIICVIWLIFSNQENSIFIYFLLALRSEGSWGLQWLGKCSEFREIHLTVSFNVDRQGNWGSVLIPEIHSRWEHGS